MPDPAVRRRNEFWRIRERSFENQRSDPPRPTTFRADYVSSRPLLRHALRNDRSERSSQRVRAPRESWLRYGLEDAPVSGVTLRDDGNQQSAAEQYLMQSRLHGRMLSPPYSGGDRSNRSSPANHEFGNSIDPSSLTPRFAPAYRLEEAEGSTRRSPPDSVSPRPESQPAEAAEDSLRPPSLRRVGNRSVSNANRPPSRHARLSFDGLGDRDRSFSPEEDSWENLLTTIAPDEQLPSTDSSFTSAAATSFTSQPGGSATTQLTTPTSITEDQDPDFFPNCDISDSETSDTHSDSSHPGLNLRRATSLREEARSLSQEAERLRQSTRELNEQTRELTSQRSETTAQRMMDNDQELGQMRSILDRMSRREDIPDDWWAAAGLTRSNVGSAVDGMLETLGGQLELLVGRIDRLERERL